MLKDLETLILQTHQDQSERLSRIEDQLQEVHRLFVQPSKQDLSPELSRPEVPFELSQKFEKAVFGNGQDLTTFPLEEGLNAFFRHFKDVGRSISKSFHADTDAVSKLLHSMSHRISIS
jgi:hypothetical protein